MNSKNKLESLLNKISNTGSVKPTATEETHFDKKQRRISQLVESKKKNVLQQEFGIDVKGDIFDTAMNAYLFDGETEEGTVAEVAEAWRRWERGEVRRIPGGAREGGRSHYATSDCHTLARTRSRPQRLCRSSRGKLAKPSEQSCPGHRWSRESEAEKRGKEE